MNIFISRWTNQADIVFVLGVCPFLVIITNTLTGFSMGIICFVTIVFTCTLISFLRDLIPLELRFPVIIIVSSTVISLFSLVLQYWFYPLSEVVGIYILLIAVNCIILTLAEEVSFMNTVFFSFNQSLRIGTGLLLFFIVIGILRELAGFGTIFQQAEFLFGEPAKSWTIQLIDSFSFILVKQTPGAFLILGLLIAGINYVIKKNEQQVTS